MPIWTSTPQGLQVTCPSVTRLSAAARTICSFMSYLQVWYHRQHIRTWLFLDSPRRQGRGDMITRETGHSRPTAISTSFRSPTPSALPSPTPSSPGADGLSRRLSWSRPQESSFVSGQTNMADMRTLAPPSRTRLVSDYGMEEYDIGTSYGRRTPEESSTRLWERSGNPRPFFHQMDSTTSFESIHSNGSGADGREERDQHIPFASSSTSHPAQLMLPNKAKTRNRVYDEDGLARGSRNLTASVTRSPTFRAVSNTLRKASVRISSMMSPGRDDGRTRIPDGDDEDKGVREGIEMDPFHPPPVALDPGKPGALPPEIKVGLRGRTLCLFSADNVVRRTCSNVLNWP